MADKFSARDLSEIELSLGVAPFLSALSRNQRKGLQSFAVLETWQAESFVLRENVATTPALYILLQGQAFYHRAGEKKVVFFTGQRFGEELLEFAQELDHDAKVTCPYSVQAARQPIRCARIDLKHIRQIHPTVDQTKKSVAVESYLRRKDNKAGNTSLPVQVEPQPKQELKGSTPSSPQIRTSTEAPTKSSKVADETKVKQTESRHNHKQRRRSIAASSSASSKDTTIGKTLVPLKERRKSLAASSSSTISQFTQDTLKNTTTNRRKSLSTVPSRTRKDSTKSPRNASTKTSSIESANSIKEERNDSQQTGKARQKAITEEQNDGKAPKVKKSSTSRKERRGSTNTKITTKSEDKKEAPPPPSSMCSEYVLVPPSSPRKIFQTKPKSVQSPRKKSIANISLESPDDKDKNNNHKDKNESNDVTVSQRKFKKAQYDGTAIQNTPPSLPPPSVQSSTRKQKKSPAVAAAAAINKTATPLESQQKLKTRDSRNNHSNNETNVDNPSSPRKVKKAGTTMTSTPPTKLSNRKETNVSSENTEPTKETAGGKGGAASSSPGKRRSSLTSSSSPSPGNVQQKSNTASHEDRKFDVSTKGMAGNTPPPSPRKQRRKSFVIAQEEEDLNISRRSMAGRTPPASPRKKTSLTTSQKDQLTTPHSPPPPSPPTSPRRVIKVDTSPFEPKKTLTISPSSARRSVGKLGEESFHFLTTSPEPAAKPLAATGNPRKRIPRPPVSPSRSQKKAVELDIHDLETVKDHSVTTPLHHSGISLDEGSKSRFEASLSMFENGASNDSNGNLNSSLQSLDVSSRRRKLKRDKKPKPSDENKLEMSTQSWGSESASLEGKLTQNAGTEESAPEDKSSSANSPVATARAQDEYVVSTHLESSRASQEVKVNLMPHLSADTKEAVQSQEAKQTPSNKQAPKTSVNKAMMLRDQFEGRNQRIKNPENKPLRKRPPRNVEQKPIYLKADYIAPRFEKSKEEEKQITGALERCKFPFKSMQKRNLKALITAFEPQRATAGTQITERGSSDDTLFIVTKGEIRVNVDGDNVGSVKSGEVFGEDNLVRPDASRNREVSLTAICDTDLFKVNQTTYRSILQVESKAMEERKIELVNKLQILSKMSKETKQKMINIMKHATFEEGEMIPTRDVSTRLYLVEEGTVHCQNPNNGNDKGRTVAAGQTFGEAAFMRGVQENKAIKAKAETDVSAFYVDLSMFEKAIGPIHTIFPPSDTKDVDSAVPSYDALRFNKKKPLTIAERRAVVLLFKDRIFEKGDVILEANTPLPACLYFLRLGVIEAHGSDAATTVDFYMAGCFFGKDVFTGALDSNSQKASSKKRLVAIEKCIVSVMSVPDFCKTRALYLKKRNHTGGHQSSDSSDSDESESSIDSSSNVDMEEIDAEDMVETERWQTFKFADLEKKTLLGEGGFGQVWLVTNKKDTEPKGYALKIQSKYELTVAGDAEVAVREKNIMASLHHPNVIKLLASYQDQHFLYFVLNLVQGGELYNILNPIDDEDCPKALSNEQARFYAFGIADALAHVHAKGFVYRDVKVSD